MPNLMNQPCCGAPSATGCMTARPNAGWQHSEERLRQVIDNAGDAIFLRDEQGRIVDVNRRACESLGYTREELLSMSITDIDAEFAPRSLERCSRRTDEEYPVTFEGIHRRKDGSTFPVEIRLAPLNVGPGA